ncbi:MAG: carboxymuconolactone decarboxylase family protein [Acidimicrobiia bacterium]|nr:carboxymuconolactone decarboxylase family protein [Acidimicrobiia bacterium]
MSDDKHVERRAALRAGYRDLAAAIPTQMKGFGDLHRSSVADGALSRATKELMSLAIGISTRCEDCVTLHLYDALQAGATDEEVHETIGVALMMGGGPASTAATGALETLAEYRRA